MGSFMTRASTKPGGTRIADLRAGVRASSETPHFDKPPPQPRKKSARTETDDDRAAKAERQAQVLHTTSLLTGKSSSRPYVRKGERPERKGTMLGLLFQVIFVVGAVAGIAYAIDPAIIPPEWIDQAQGHIGNAREQIDTWIDA